MAALVVSPPVALLEQGQSVDLTVTLESFVDRLRWRDDLVPVGHIALTYSTPEPLSGWTITAIDSPLEWDLIESDATHAVFRVTWPL